MAEQDSATTSRLRRRSSEMNSEACTNGRVLPESLQQALAAADRYFELLDTKPEIQDIPDAVNLKDAKAILPLKMSISTMMKPRC
jgi:ABC-type multidrug transport system fused ATPase/permease subunit